MSIPGEATSAPLKAASADGSVWFVDQNRYFGINCPAGWDVTELKDKVGLTLQAPSIVGEWRARVKLNVRLCQRGQTLDQTLYLVRSETLQMSGFKFAGQSAGQHPSGKPAGTLRWAMMQGFIELFVEQLFVAVSPGVIVQITASAAGPTYPRHRAAFGSILTSFRPQPALLARAKVWGGQVGDAKPRAAEGGAAVTQVVEAGAGAAAIRDVAGVPVAKVAPVPQPAPRAPVTPPQVQVPPTAPAEELTIDLADEGKPEIAKGKPEAKTEGLAIDLSLEANLVVEEAGKSTEISQEQTEVTLELAEADGGNTAAIVERAETPISPKVQTKEPKAKPAPAALAPLHDGKATAAPTPPPADCTAAYTRLWVFLDRTAKSFVSEMRKASKRNGIKPGQKALFEGRAYLCDVLRRVIDAAPAPEGAKERGGELNMFIQKKIAGRSREVRDQFVERLSAYAKAPVPREPTAIGEPQELAGTTIDVLGGYLAGSRDDEAGSVNESQNRRQEFLEALAELDGRLGGDFRDRVSTLFSRWPTSWAVLDATDIEAELGHG